MIFQDKQIVLGVTGGIAAYKAAEVLRLLVKAGANVHVIMTRHAREFVTPLTFQTLSGNPVHTDMFSLIQEQDIGHISLADRADLIMIVPATANTIGKVANGLADDLLTTTLLASKAPILFVPAMNVNMWENPLYRQNQAKLEEHGYHFMAPAVGALACGWEGQGKLPAPEDIFDYAQALVSAQRELGGKTVLVTAGPTREELDPVRFLSNYSSGKMGYAIARAARNQGARVILVSGPVHLPAPQGVELVRVTTAMEMLEAVLSRSSAADVIIKAAAVADYRPAERQARKIKKGQEDKSSLNLQRNPDILAELGKLKGRRVLVGFAAETGDLQTNAAKKLQEKNLDLIVANDVLRADAGFDGDNNAVQLHFRGGATEELPLMTKDEVAEALMARIIGILEKTGGA